MDRSDIRRAIEQPRSTRRRIRLGDVDRLHPGGKLSGRGGSGSRLRSMAARVGPVGTVVVGVALGVLAALAMGPKR